MRTGLLRHPLEGWVDPALVFSALYSASETAFWLDSGVDARAGRSHMGTSSRVLEAAAGHFSRTFFDLLAADLESRRLPDAADTTGSIGALGWVGWLGYEARGATLGIAPKYVSRYPDAFFMFVDRCVSFDHETHTVELIALGDEWTGELADWRGTVIAAIAASAAESESALSGTASATAAVTLPATHVATQGATATVSAENGGARGTGAPRVTWRYTDADYLAMIEACQAEIVEGNAYQLCLTTEVDVGVSPDPVATYLALRVSSPSHHGALIVAATETGSVALLSSSPEQFVTVTPGGTIETKPIKGTRRRGATESEDEALRAELRASDKERAENLMIVDLSRNDIARVSEIGSVTVPALLDVETYAHVHQLVSTVRGHLASGFSAVDAVSASFPAGSMTGAPKVSATQILEAVERRARGIYSGAFGVWGLDGSVDLAMVIRSIIIDDEGSTVGTGGGITALSEPAEELEEVRLKAAALLAVLGVT